MKTVEDIKERRSVRNFNSKKVELDLIKEIIELAKYAPSWNNFQIVRYNVIEDKTIIDEIMNDALLGFQHNIGIVNGASGIIVLSNKTGKSGIFPGIQKTPQEWEMFDAGCAAQTLSIAAHTKGVGTVILGAFDQDKISRVLSLPSDEYVAAIIPYGYESSHPVAPIRKGIDEILRIFR